MGRPVPEKFWDRAWSALLTTVCVCDDPALRGLPSRSKGFTSTSRRGLHAAGGAYFTTLLCTTTTLLNSIQAAEFWEINGISPQGHFGSTSAEMGITYQAFAKDFGYNLKKVIAELYVKMPVFVWIAPYVRGALLQEAPLLCSGGTTFEPNGDARTLPGNWRREPVLRWREAVTSPGNGLWT